MLTEVLVEVLKEHAKERFPAYALALFWSEIFAALGTAVGFSILFGNPLPMLFIFYAADVGASLGIYQAKREREHGRDWTPSVPMKFAGLWSGLFRILMAAGTAVLAFDGGWLLLLFAGVLAASGLLRTTMLLRTGWIEPLPVPPAKKRRHSSDQLPKGRFLKPAVASLLTLTSMGGGPPEPVTNALWSAALRG